MYMLNIIYKIMNKSELNKEIKNRTLKIVVNDLNDIKTKLNDNPMLLIDAWNRKDNWHRMFGKSEILNYTFNKLFPLN